MSKQARQEEVLYEDELPPPYSPTTASSQPHGPSIPSIFSAHLSDLPSRILSAQAARSSARDQRDSEILALMVPYVEDLLSSIAVMSPPPSLVEMAMVPEDAVGSDWKFSDNDERRQGEVRLVSRIRASTKGDGDGKGPGRIAIPESTLDEREFDEWGRWEGEGESSDIPTNSRLWWSDEDMAHRLAKHLQPEPRLDRQTVRAQVQHLKEAKKPKRWSLFRKEEPSSAPTSVAPSTPTKDDEEDVTMAVRASEVTFRKQNEMGIWESRTGWGVVVRVKIRQT